MKTLTYAAAIALLTASAAFAQSSGNSSSSMQNMPAQSRTMSGPDQQGQGQSMSNQDMSGKASTPSADSKSDMTRSSAKPSTDQASNHTAKAKAKTHRVASKAPDRGQNARENQITEQLNQQQLAAGGGMSASGGRSGTGGSNGASFNSGAPQQAQAGGPNCTPDNPSCGTARQNPAIQSSPQHRTYNASPQ
jgi:hypothetical protein